MKPNYKYNSLPEFRKAHSNLYDQLYRRGEILKLCEDMGWEYPKQTNPKGHWNIKENCFKESEKHNNITQFFKNSQGAYTSAKRNGWLEEIKQLMNW